MRSNSRCPAAVTLTLVFVLCSMFSPGEFAARSLAAEGFVIQETPRDHVAVSLDGKLVAKFMTAHDVSTPQQQHETYKPYLHVFSPDGQTRLTKGSGFQFTHHRGIFVGYNKISHGGKSYDRWHMKGGDQVVTSVAVGKDELTAAIDWNADPTTPFLKEERRLTFSKPASPFYLGVELNTAIKSLEGEAIFDGDPEHAGAQFRPSELIDTSTATYILPGEKTDAHKARDLPWVAEVYSVEGKTFTVVILNHPDNPKDTAFSAYRNYGRFGAFPKGTANPNAPFKLKYQWLIAAGDVRDPAVFQKAWNQYANRNEPTPAVTVSLAEGAKPKAATKADGK